MKNMNKTNVLKISISLLMLILAVIGFSMAACSNGSTDPIPQTVATPTASPPAGTYAAAQSVTLNTATAGASIYYTTNDSTPTTGSTLYNGAITISATTTLKAIAVKEGMNNSAVLTAVYTISGSSRPTAVNITINKTGDETGDSITASPTSGQIGDEITINYTLANRKHNNRLVFSGTTAPIAEVDIAETGTRTYTIAQEDVADETITINAVFTHSDKTHDTIAFADTNNETRTYGTATFTKAISNTGTGTRTITYSSSDTAVATVDETSGTVTIKKVGKTTITATKAEDATYAQATAEYELTIDPLQLTISNPTVTTTKQYDGTTTATITTLGTLNNKVVSDVVTVSAEANYNSADVGNNINITVVYSIEGTDKDNYIKPVNYTTSGSIYPIAVTLNTVIANGSDTQTTTQLTLTFSEAITGLSADDITLSGVMGITKGTLGGSGPAYTLPISGFITGGTLSVAVSKTGYTISGSPKDVTIYYYTIITITSDTGIEMVSIPAGTFTMGSPANEPNHYSEETQHSVTLSGFSMSKYQVTQKQYQAVMGAGEDRSDNTYGKGDNYPIYSVNWYDAIVFCNKLSVMEGLDPVYSIGGSTDPANWGAIPTSSNSTWNSAVMDRSKNGYRLPTEAEWEYACRAGTITPFNTGDNITTDQANYNGNYPYNGNAAGIYREKTTPVGSFAANAWGLYDMHGNVWEWCWDWYSSSYYSSSPTNDPSGASSGSYRVFRGGSWSNGGEYLRSAGRFSLGPSGRDCTFGFRLARP
ncbi:hypothetical protein R84B8_00633 [Treponema sp. R8-4-B8]